MRFRIFKRCPAAFFHLIRDEPFVSPVSLQIQSDAVEYKRFVVTGISGDLRRRELADPSIQGGPAGERYGRVVEPKGTAGIRTQVEAAMPVLHRVTGERRAKTDERIVGSRIPLDERPELKVERGKGFHFDSGCAQLVHGGKLIPLRAEGKGKQEHGVVEPPADYRAHTENIQ